MSWSWPAAVSVSDKVKTVVSRLPHIPATCKPKHTCRDSLTCCDSTKEAADHTCYFTKSQNTDTRPTSLSTNLVRPGTWQGSHKGTTFKSVVRLDQGDGLQGGGEEGCHGQQVCCLSKHLPPLLECTFKASCQGFSMGIWFPSIFYQLMVSANEIKLK